jgi:hypothetical protein
MVGVSIDNGDTNVGARDVNGADGDGDIVQHAIAQPPVGVGVMGAAGEICGDAVGEGRLGGKQRAARFEA